MRRTPPAESIVLERARAGNESAFLALYREHRTPVFRFAWRLTGSTQAAEDITQECFLALLSGARFDSNRGQLRTYLFGVARHFAIKRLRLDDREPEEPVDCAAPEDALGDLLKRERAS